MKKAIMVLAMVAMAGNTFAWNWNIFGSDDKHKRRPVATQQQPDNPVSVPEPSSLILLGAGLVGIAVARRKHEGE